MEQKSKFPIDQILTVGTELISDKPPKTLAGKILRWVKRIVRVKNLVGVKFILAIGLLSFTSCVTINIFNREKISEVKTTKIRSIELKTTRIRTDSIK